MAQEEKLSKITFLRLFPQQNFGNVDNIINEITLNANKSKIEKKVEKIDCEIQTDDVLFASLDGERDKKDDISVINEPPVYPPQATFTLPLLCGTSFQYNSEAELASLKGRIASRFCHQEPSLASPLQINPSNQQMQSIVVEKSSLPLDESLETQQMRRLGEFIEWRRSLLHDNYL